MPSDNSQIPTKVMITVLILAAALLAVSCKECPTEPESGNIILSTAYIATQSVYLKINVSDSLNATEIRIKRDTTTILTTTLISGDTLIIDDSLQPGKTYTYQGYLLDRGEVMFSGEILPVTTMDTTTHEIYSWEIDTLGLSGEINDVWIVDENNIWVVGYIRVDDPDSSFDGNGQETFNAAHWNGEEWELMRIINSSPIFSIFYLSADDIWMVSYGYPVHWDGNNWILYRFQDMGINASSLSLWGTSSSNIYFVGLEGSIVHYDGQNFEKMESGTDCNLDDVYGLDGSHIWAVGSAAGEFQSVILRFDGTQWKILHDTGYMGSGYWTKSVWTDSPCFLFLNGGSGRIFYDLIRNELHKDMTAGRWYGFSIDGLGYNDIFASTAGSEVLHYNGSTWHLYTEIKDHFGDYYRINGDYYRIKTIKVEENIIVAGGYWYTGLYGLPIVIRGYR